MLKSKFNDVIGLQDFFEQLRFFLTQAGEAKWAVAEFDKKSMMQENGFDFTCPPLVPCGHFTEKSPKVSKKSIVYLWHFRIMIIVAFQFKLDFVQMDFDDPILHTGFPWWSIWLRQRAGWRDSLGNTRPLHPVTVINEILQLYSTYTKKAVEEFTQVEMQISTGYMDQLETFLSKFLCKYSGIYRMCTT